MFCPQCGKGYGLNANFCSSCGATLQPPVPSREARIVRPRFPRMIAGVCSGYAFHFGWNLTAVRIGLAVFTLLTSGVGLLCYLAAWILLPEAPYALPAPPAAYRTAAYQPPGPMPDHTQQGTGA